MKKYELDKAKGAAPLYEQILKIEHEKISNFEYKYGQLMPTEEEMREMYGVSRITIRQVYAYLEQEHYIKRIKGRGTVFDYNVKYTEDVIKAKGFEDNIRRLDENYSIQSVKITTMLATEIQAGTLGINFKDKINCIEIVKCVNNRPVCVTETYIDAKYEIADDGSLYKSTLDDVLKKSNVPSPSKISYKIDAIMPTPNVAKLFSLGPESPILRRAVMTYDANKNAITYTNEYFDAAQYSFVYNKLQRKK